MRLLSDEPNSAARRWLVSGSVWFAVATTFGLVGALEMAVPDFLGGIRYLVFPRVRPCHVQGVLFGFVSMTLVGAGLYYVPRVSATRLYSEKVAQVALWIWNAAVVAILITLPLGLTQAHEYAEPVWPIGVAIVIALCLLIYDTFETLAHREEPLLYVSSWYFIGALVWTAILYAFLGGIGWHTGVYDAVWTWFYGHNIFGLWLTPLALGAAYYTVPRGVNQPVFSHSLSLLGFWTLVAFYSHAGVHHLIQAPVPAWQKVVASVDSGLLLIAVYAFLANIWLTMRGRTYRVEQSVAMKFIYAGTIWYFLVSTQGSLQSLVFVQRYEHFTNWVVGHAHIGVLGFAGFIASGALYDVLPEVSHRRAVYSANVANFQFWLMLLGVTGFFLILTAAGLIQGQAWLNGELEYRVIPELRIHMVARALVGTFIVVGAYLQLYNVLMTVRGEPPVREPGEPGVTVTEEPVPAAKEEG